MLEELKKFILRGNVLDLAVGVIIGAAFGGIVKSLVDDILMPPLGLVLGKVDFSNLFINLSGNDKVTSVAVAKSLGAPTINYGIFLNQIINFLIIATAVFLVVKQVNKLMPKAETPATTKECPHCLNKIPLAATKCGFCTSELEKQVNS